MTDSVKPSTLFLKRHLNDVQPWAETCGQIRPLLEEQDGGALREGIRGLPKALMETEV